MHFYGLTYPNPNTLHTTHYYYMLHTHTYVCAYTQVKHHKSCQASAGELAARAALAVCVCVCVRVSLRHCTCVCECWPEDDDINVAAEVMMIMIIT